MREYGCDAVTISLDGSLIFLDLRINGFFRLKSAKEVQPVVKGTDRLRYADFDIHLPDMNLIIDVYRSVLLIV